MRIEALTAALLLTVAASGCSVHDNPFYNAARRELNASISTQPGPSLTGVVAVGDLGVQIDFRDTSDWHAFRPGDVRMYQFNKLLDRAQMHTAAIQIYPIVPPRQEFDGIEDFARYIQADLDKLRDKGGNDLVFEVVQDASKAPLCVLFHRQVRGVDDRQAPGVPLIFEEFEYICQHPGRAHSFVNMTYSERVKEADADADFQMRAKQMLERITFSQTAP